MRLFPAAIDTPLGKRLVGLSLFRLAVLAVFLVITELYYLKQLPFGGFSSAVAATTAGIVFLMSALYALMLRRARGLPAVAHVQLVTDQLTWTAIVYISGGVTSGSASLYGLTCLSGAILLGTPGAVSAAAAGTGGYLAMCAGLAGGWLRPPSDQPRDAYLVSVSDMVYPAFSTVMAMLVVTVLAAYLADRLQAFGGRLEAATRRAEAAERLAALGRLAAGLAHEIRNPLGSIRGSIELLRSGGALSAEDQKLCLIIERETARLNALVTDVVDLSRPRTPDLSDNDLAETANDVVRLAASSTRGGDVGVGYVGPASVMLKADAGQLHQLLWNLVRNAMQVSSPGSEVVVRIDASDGGDVTLSVSDEGPGIPESKRDHIFDAFFTTHEHGVGIGLAVVKQIVDAHGFALDVDCGADTGTVFRVRIPAAARLAPVLLACLLLGGSIGCSGSDWVRPGVEGAEVSAASLWEPAASSPSLDASAAPGSAPAGSALAPATPGSAADGAAEPIAITLTGPAPHGSDASGSTALYRNTYYYFPEEPTWPETGPTRVLSDAACRPIRTVSQDFHDQLCVQGSGRLATGETVSFAKRDCPCAAECPRTGQKICFELLDKKRFPYGRGATGKPITPLRTVAVDTLVIPLGTVIYIPAYHGLRDLGGQPHDGCFVAEDRGLRVKGKHVDLFVGNAATAAAWNAAVPSNQGVRVVAGAPRCAHLGSDPDER